MHDANEIQVEYRKAGAMIEFILSGVAAWMPAHQQDQQGNCCRR
jgi:hypothetical protein